MKKSLFFFIFLSVLLVIFTSCKKDELPYSTNLVDNFVYDGLSTYYYWSDEMTSKKPNVSDTDPTAYFQRILNTGDRFSWITDDVQGLLAEFAGTPKEFGFALTFAQSPTASTEYYAVVKYVFPNTPASQANIKRLTLIGKINGSPITESNYSKLYGADAITLSLYKLVNSEIVYDKDVTVTPQTIDTDPVLCDSVYNINGHKFGYLFYTDFIANYNSSLYNAFDKFRQEGVTDLVLDLRYNHGGALSAATYLASLIAPSSIVQAKSVFTILSYNSYINNYFDKEGVSRSEKLGGYSSDEQNPLGANLNLNKVYIIATGDSYSASELTTYCLKPYMNVVQIGDTTGGKYVASWTIHAFDENLGVPVYDSTSMKVAQKDALRNWAMQPIVAKYTNKDGLDFSTPGFLLPDYQLKEGGNHISNWKQIGDTADTFLAQAIYLIEGNSGIKPNLILPMRIKSTTMRNIKELPDVNDVRKSAVILDNQKFTKKQMQNIRKVLQYK